VGIPGTDEEARDPPRPLAPVAARPTAGTYVRAAARHATASIRLDTWLLQAASAVELCVWLFPPLRLFRVGDTRLCNESVEGTRYPYARLGGRIFPDILEK